MHVESLSTVFSTAESDAFWCNDYLQNISGFPNARHDDQVDSTTQFIMFAEANRREIMPRVSPILIPRHDPWPDWMFDSWRLSGEEY